MFAMLISLMAPAEAADFPPPPIVRVNPPRHEAYFVDEFSVRTDEGRWSVYEDRTHIEALTKGSGKLLGVTCKEYCLIYLRFISDCEPMKEYPVVVDTPEGRHDYRMVCYDEGGDSRTLMSSSQGKIVTILRAGGEMGVTITLDDGTLDENKFSLDGAYTASEKIVAYIAKKRAARMKTGTEQGR